jgi:hypothetical protein
MTEDNNTEDRFITTRGIIVTGWFLLIILCMLIVGSTLYLILSGSIVPEVLINWTSTVLGFLFGTFITLIKEFITKD